MNFDRKAWMEKIGFFDKVCFCCCWYAFTNIPTHLQLRIPDVKIYVKDKAGLTSRGDWDHKKPLTLRQMYSTLTKKAFDSHLVPLFSGTQLKSFILTFPAVVVGALPKASYRYERLRQLSDSLEYPVGNIDPSSDAAAEIMAEYNLNFTSQVYVLW